MVKEHGVFLGPEDRDAYASPEEGNVVEPVLEDLAYISIAQEYL